LQMEVIYGFYGALIQRIRLMIHPTAIIAPDAHVSENVEIGPYCVIGSGVTVGSGCRLHAHVVIERNTSVGTNCEFFPFSAIGGKTQDLKYDGEPTTLVIGDYNVFRENTTIHRSTSKTVPTRIGNHNLFLAYSHVAHDCQVGNHIIFSNNGTIAGHVTVDDHAIISGLAGVHQFCRVGKHSIVGGCTKIVQDIPPYMIVDGNPAVVRGINLVGMQRRGFTKDQIREVKEAYKALFMKKDIALGTLVNSLASAQGLAAEIRDFVESSERGVTR